MGAQRDQLSQRLDAIASQVDACLQADPAQASLAMKPICRGLADTAAGLCLAREAEIWPMHHGTKTGPEPADLLCHFLQLGSEKESADLALLERLA